MQTCVVRILIGLIISTCTPNFPRSADRFGKATLELVAVFVSRCLDNGLMKRFTQFTRGMIHRLFIKDQAVSRVG